MNSLLPTKSEKKMFERYKGSPWHRIKLFFRGILGLILCIPLALMTLLYLLLELGNRTIDVMFEES